MTEDEWLALPAPEGCQCVAIPYGACVLKFMHGGHHINAEGVVWPDTGIDFREIINAGQPKD